MITLQNDSAKSRRMESGIGASWHSLIFPTAAHGGSGFGGSPPVLPIYEGLWQSIEEQATTIGLKFIRAEFSWAGIQPTINHLAIESQEMRILERILSWADRNDADVLLQCMWGGTHWHALPDLKDDPVWETCSAPADIEVSTAVWQNLLDYLRLQKSHRCIRWIHLVNEPGVSWWRLRRGEFSPEEKTQQMAYLGLAQEKAAAMLREYHPDISLMGAGLTDIPRDIVLAEQPWFASADVVDFHTYGACFDHEDPANLAVPWAYRMKDRIETHLARMTAEAHAAGKPLFLTEFGSMAYGWGEQHPQHPGPSTFHALLKDAELIIRALTVGVGALCRWSFVNRGDQDGLWQIIDTWDPQRKCWLDCAHPQPTTALVLSRIMQLVGKRNYIFPVSVVSDSESELVDIHAIAIGTTDDHAENVLVVNHGCAPVQVMLRINNPNASWYQITQDSTTGHAIENKIHLQAEGAISLLPESITYMK